MSLALEQDKCLKFWFLIPQVSVTADHILFFLDNITNYVTGINMNHIWNFSVNQEQCSESCQTMAVKCKYPPYGTEPNFNSSDRNGQKGIYLNANS